MAGFTDVFGGSAIQPGQVAYAPIALTAALPTYWPPFATGTQQPLARIMEVVSSTSALSIRLPDAMLASVGQDVFFSNKSAFTVSVQDVSGNSVATVLAGQTRYVYLTNNTTSNGTWASLLFGVGSSSPDASQLAGFGIKAIGSTLNQSSVTATISTDQTFGPSDRSKLYVNTGAAITCTFPLTGTVGNDYFIELRNQGSGVVTLAPQGGELIDGSASITLQLNESCFVQAGSGAWYTVGRGRNTQFNFTQLLKTVTGGTTTLSLTEASNVVQTYSGALVSNQILVLPAVVQVYYIANKCTGAFTFTIQSPTPGNTLSLPNNQNAVVFCDGVNVINASTSVAGITSLLLSAGSAGAPSLAILAANNGLFAPNSSAIAVTAGATELMRWAGGQSLAGVNGTAGSPAYSFLSAPGAGMYTYGTASLAWSTNSAVRMQLTATGDLTPAVDNAQALGGPSFRWSQVYAATAAFTSLQNTKLQNFTETVVPYTISTGTFTIDLSLSNVFDITLNASTVITFTNPPASGTLKGTTIIVRQGTGGGKTLAVTNAKYTDGVVPTLSSVAGQIDMLSYFTVDAGASYFGMYAMANIS